MLFQLVRCESFRPNFMTALARRALFVAALAGASLASSWGIAVAVADEPPAEPPPETTAPEVLFSAQVAPILLGQCVACHNAKLAEGSYRLDTFAALREAGDSGESPLPESPEAHGELLRRVLSDDADERMPADAPPLPAEQLEILKAWVEQGAKFDGSDEGWLLPQVIPAVEHPQPPEVYPAPMPITAVIFSPDGEQLLTAGYHEVHVWEAASGRLVRRITNLSQRVLALGFDHAGERLLVAGGEPGRSGELRVVDYASGEVLAVPVRTGDVVLDLAVRPGANQVAVGSADQLIRLVDLDRLEIIQTWATHADWVSALAWSPDGQRLVSASRDKSAKVIDAEAGQVIHSYRGHQAAVRGVAFSADGAHVMSSGSDNRLHRWPVAGGRADKTVPLGSEGFRLLLADQMLLVPTAGQKLSRFKVEDLAADGSFEGFQDWVVSAAWQPDRGLLAGGGFDGQVRLWQTSDGELLHAWSAVPSP